MDKKKLIRLQEQGLPHCTTDFLKPEVNPDATAAEVAEAQNKIRQLNEYFAIFLPPGKCIYCGAQLGAKDITDSILGMIGNPVATFTWGLQHGEGYCSKCGYPGRAMHYIGDWFSLRNFILQYHPDSLKVNGHRWSSETI